MATLPTYVLITPARNEAQFIEGTIKSVLSQTVKPQRWVIVSDGSTDGTDEIVRRYTANCPWIELVRMPERVERHFAGKVHAFNAGYERIGNLPYEVIVSLDADITLESGHFAFLLQKLVDDPKLGLVGTPFRETASQMYDYRFANIEHVSGACQVFRRECFESIGGYVPIKSGGVDQVMVISARMKGWKTRTFTEMTCLHHRPMGTAQSGLLKARFDNGIKDYLFGNHPLWEICRLGYQMSRTPYIVGAIMLMSGYLLAMMKRMERPVSGEFVAFTRREQVQRLERLLGRTNLIQSAVPHPPSERA